MSTHSPLDPLRDAIIDAAERLARAETRALSRNGPPTPGDVYVFDLREPLALTWLVTREHADDSNLILLVPGDDFPFAGLADVRIPLHVVERPLTFRCGEGFWAPLTLCQNGQRTDSIPPDAVASVRKMLANLARGRVEASAESSQVDCDPEYLDWLDLVADARRQLQERMDRHERNSGEEEREVIALAQLPKGIPPDVDNADSYSLAAESGGGLLAELAAASDRAVAADRYYQVALPSGKLTFLIDDEGARGIWRGTEGAEPPTLVARTAAGESCQAVWQSSREGDLRCMASVFPWIGREVVVAIDGGDGKTVVFQR